MAEHALIVLAGIALLGIACQWIAWWIKLPAILFLLLAGILAGPVTGWLAPDALFGDLLLPLVSLAVAVILFEGSLTLNFRQIRGQERVVRNLVTFGTVVSGTASALATRYLVGLSWELAFLFGALIVVTGPTVIIPMLRTVRPTARVANILRWEGIIIDPLGALLAVLVFDFILSAREASALLVILGKFGLLIGIGTATGSLAGYLLGTVLRRFWMPEYLHSVATLCAVFGVFAGANQLEPESGLLAVTVMGIWLANMKDVPIEEILDFKESLTIFLISAVFILLAARIDLADLHRLGWAALGVFAIMQFGARPLKVLLATLGSDLTWRERALLAWIGPRGIVAAAVAAAFALRLEQAGFAQAPDIVSLTFMVIIGTVVLQSATAGALARALGVAEPEPRGLLIIGANAVARAIAEALQEKGFRALLADPRWENIRHARMQGLATYYGNPISEYADRHLELVGIGRLLGLSPRGDRNLLAGVRYQTEFGKNHVYTLQTEAEKQSPQKYRVAARYRGYTLFGKDVTYAKLASLISQGAAVRATKLTEAFDLEAYRERHGRRAIPLFALTPRGRLRVFVADGKMCPEAGWTILSLVLPEEEAPRSSLAESAVPRGAA